MVQFQGCHFNGFHPEGSDMTTSTLPVLGRPRLSNDRVASSTAFFLVGAARHPLFRATLRAFDALGRALLEWSFEPIGFSFGVLFLQLHHQLLASGVASTAQVIGR